ncbi:restriction endonuclease subunit S [Pseudomonas mosselii]|uniref:restriction endonuclease subunit S n=1 Tax=Pseudomonas mosselii TaxID=78327 RepID=UPI002449FA72|nr:restriction endonuclease subunit S [Pseudomonas mosselii]MDH1103582.1 restriction endonuclease subunit S [Pseudomonas mosselii]
MSELPNGWARASLGDICGQPTQRVPDVGEVITYVDIASVDRDRKAVTKPQQLTGADAPSRARKVLETGDVIVSMTRPNLNAVALIGVDHNESIASTGFDVLKAIGVEPRWVFAAVRSARFVDAMCGKVQGALYPAIKSAEIREYEIPVPPANEQTRIAAKLDELLAQVEALKARIDNTPALLKRFRQSVLAAAVSGRLTEDMRKHDEYIDTEIEVEIPRTWRVYAVGDIAEVKGGKRLPKGEALTSDDTGYPYIRAGQLKNGTINLEGQLFVHHHVHTQISKYVVSAGDVYITIVGACIGDAGVVPQNCEGFNLTENAAKLCEFKIPLNSKYLAYWLRSKYLQKLIKHEIKSGVQGKLALKRIKELPFPCPSPAEQTEIVRRVEQMFALAGQLEARIKAAQVRIDLLTQSIFAKAFRGELVPQDPKDEPATVFLDRIKAQRAVAPKGKRGRRSSMAN